LKRQELNYDKLQTVQSAKDTEKSWINPIMFSYSYTKDNMLGDVETTNQVFSISVNQPVFKSGAIYYSIKYAKHSKKFNLLNVEIQKRELIKQAYDLAYDYNINKLNEKIILLNIENAKIDIRKKREEFLSGTGDSTLLNNAVLQLNSLKLNLEDLKMSLDNIKNSFKNISSVNIDEVKLPKFALIPEKKYVNQNLDLIQQKAYKKVKKDLYKMQLGNQLLSINLNGSLNYQKTDYSQNTPAFNDTDNNYYRVGVSVNLPLSFNAVNKIEMTKLDYLKSRLLITDKMLQLKNAYRNIVTQIKSIDRKISIYGENIKIYDDLIASTEDSLKAGNATELDLKIMQNSRKTMFVNIEMLKLQKQKLLLNLYYKLNSWKQ
jgi:outer membrane protein TolC